MPEPIRPIPGHYYRLNQNPYPGRVYRCDSINGNVIDLAIVKLDESEVPERIAIASYRFATMAEETDPPK